MKKFRCIFSFLNKKGVFALGLAIGIISVFFFGKIVFAEETSLPADMVQICNIPNGYELYVHASDYDVTKMAWGKNNGSDFSWYYVGPNLSEVYYRNSPDKPFVVQHNMNNLSMTPYTEIPISSSSLYVFNSLSEAQAYVNGQIDASSASNYNEIQASLSEFNDGLPKIEYLRFNTLSSTGSSLEFGLNDETVLNDFLDNGSNLYYYCKVYPIYSTVSGSSTLSSYGNSIVDKVGKWLRNFCGLDTNTFFDNHFHDNGLMIIDSFPTVSNYKKTDPFIVGDEFIFENVFDVSSIVLRIKPLSYENLTFVGLYCEVYPYSDTSPRTYGNTVYMQQFIDGDMQATVGLSQNIKTNYDEFGEQITETMGNSSQVIGEDIVLSSDNLLDYIHTGFGLSGSGGYIALMQAFFLGVPAWFWVLVSTALATNLILLSVKVFRGM